MNANLIDSLQAHSALLKSDEIAAVDFARLSGDLTEAAALLGSLQERAAAADRLLAAFRERLAQRARAIARLSRRESSLTERLIFSEAITAAELLRLADEIDREFDQTFARKLAAPDAPANDGAQLSEFRV